jgi:2-amino-4-hydroxy-6-hydroxymethyldihydropteridine diphosphokinase
LNDVPRVAIALGSNLGDRHAHLTWAVEQLRTLLTDLAFSRFHETAPVDTPDPQPDYLNAVVVGETTLQPATLLHELLAIEARRGRTRAGYHGVRTLDLDLILYGDLVVDEPNLAIPHPRFRERRFVLAPLAEVAAAWRDPVSGRTTAELLQAQMSVQEKPGTRSFG